MNKQSVERLEQVNELMANQPGDQVKFSMDRYLLNERNKRLNDPNKMSYLYVILADGNWLKVTIVGKLASTTKRLTRLESYQCEGSYCQFSPAPDEMGVWGESTPAKVGMTTLGSLLEIGGFLAYIYSETPLTFSSGGAPVKMVELTVELSVAERKEFDARLRDLKTKAEEAR
ncbi:MAG: hypothetical protein WC654_07805 [Patescibacteria group bacterium]